MTICTLITRITSSREECGFLRDVPLDVQSWTQASSLSSRVVAVTTATPHRHLLRCPISDFQWISLLEVLSRTKANLDGLARPKQHHTSAANSIIYRRVTIRSKPSSLMAKYSKIKRVELLWSCITTAVEGNWNLEEWEDIKEIERRTEKLRRKAAGRLDKDNTLESKITQDHHFYLQPSKRLKIWPSCKGRFLE